MKLFYFFLFAGSAICFLTICSPTITAEDYLYPVDLKESRNYRDVIQSMLWVTSAKYGRMDVLSAFDGEASVAVHTAGISNGRSVVTFTKAAQNLFQVLQAHQSPLNRVHVTRHDAAIPKTTALAVQSAWLAMLRNAQTPPRNAPGPGLDNSIVQFSISDDAEHALWGELPDNPGPRSRTLHHIGVLLAEYTKADQARRPRIAREIEKLARDVQTAHND